MVFSIVALIISVATLVFVITFDVLTSRGRRDE